MSSRTRAKMVSVRKNLEQIRTCYSTIANLYQDFDMMAFPMPVEVHIDQGALLKIIEYLEDTNND